MTERLLQFIWQFQYFNTNGLATQDAETVLVNSPGRYNTDQGPDFLDAKIRIGDTTWVGSVELHIRTGDWKKHQHQYDENYRNVILHVVWEDDGSRNGAPVLELQNRVSRILLKQYRGLMNRSSFIACEHSVNNVKDLVWKSWKERLLAERLLQKANRATACLAKNNYHWEETCWWMMARNFGMKINADAFEAIARSIPLNILARHKQQPHQLEALLFGQAGFLKDHFRESYPTLLKREYQFLQRKYKIRPVALPVFFLRMRPCNFPTIRLAQLAALIHHSTHFFSKIKEAETLKEIIRLLDITANDYWHYHYRFDQTSPCKKKKLGAGMITSILVNTICPLLFAYGHYHNEPRYKDKALGWLEETAPESNTITKGFLQIGVENKTAFDSQALIELKSRYCDEKRCLECGVGNYLLKPAYDKKVL